MLHFEELQLIAGQLLPSRCRTPAAESFLSCEYVFVKGFKCLRGNVNGSVPLFRVIRTKNKNKKQEID